MSERTDEREVGDVDLSDLEDGESDAGGVGFDDADLGVDVDALTSEPGAASSDQAAGGAAEAQRESASSTSTLRSRLGGVVRNPFPSPPSPRSFGVSLAVTVAFMLVVGSVVPLPASGLLGVAAGAFALGLLSGRRRYLELVVSGAVAAGLSLVAGSLTLAALAGLAVPLAAFGAGGGALAALLGHYFGRDLRDGLTREV